MGLPALRAPGRPGQQNPPAAPRTEPYKTHLAYVKERRSDADGAAILEEALGRLRASRELSSHAQRDGKFASWSLMAVARVALAVVVGMAEVATCTTWSPRTSAP